MCALTRDEQQLLNYYDAQRDELFALLQKLVQIDTQNFISHGRRRKGRTTFSSGFQPGVSERHAMRRIPCRFTDHPAYHPGAVRTIARTSRLFMTIGQKKQALMIAAHTDTMPVGDPERGVTRPGGVIEEAACTAGRGDNKAGLAA